MQGREFRLQRPDGGLAKRKGWLFTQETFPAWARKRPAPDDIADPDGGLVKRAPWLQTQSTETFPGWLHRANSQLAAVEDEPLRRPVWFQAVAATVIPPLPCPYIPSRLLTDTTSSPTRSSATADSAGLRSIPDADSIPARKPECR